MPEPELTVLYDADCGFCRWSVAWLLQHAQDGAVQALAIQSAEARALLLAAGVPARRSAALRARHCRRRLAGRRCAAEGKPHRSSRRVLRGPTGRAVALAIGVVPAPLRDFAYRRVAANRIAVGRLVSAKRRARADEVLAGHGR